MKSSILALSADLRRISYWLYYGNLDLANKFLNSALATFGQSDVKVGKSTLGDELKKIASVEGGEMRAADRALTTSTLLQSA